MSLTPKNWAEFQHYKDRSPSWIKLHRSILDNYEFSCLPVASRALAPMLWLLASEYEQGHITASLDEIAFRLRMPVANLTAALKPLVDAEFFQAGSGLLADRKQAASPEREGQGKVERERHKREVEGGGGVAARGVSAKAEIALIAGPLFKKFSEAYRGPVGRAAERKFHALLMAGENADPIIEAAPRANPEMPAEQWLDERGWAQLSLLPAAERKPLISPEAMALGDEIATVAGQDLQFLEPGWCGAAWRCQQWLDSGYPRELIVAGVKAMVTQKAPEKISGVAYFDKGLARFIAQQTRPVPKVIEQQAETVEVIRGKVRDDSRSGVAAIDRVWDRLTGADPEAEPGGGEEGPQATVQRLPA
jgi:hypothetical protein